MKQITVLSLILTLLLTFSACGKTEEASGIATDIETVTVEAEIAETEEGQVEESVETVIIEVSESDFSIADLGDGTCEVISCTSDADTIEVPETLYGCTVIGIGQYAFNGVEASYISLPDTVEYIDDYAFSLCSNLTNVSFGNRLQRTGTMIFVTCGKLETVTFPDGMKTMEGVVFGTCESLREVYIPASVDSIPQGIANSVLCPNIVIVTPAGSTAEAVALEAGLSVKNS